MVNLYERGSDMYLPIKNLPGALNDCKSPLVGHSLVKLRASPVMKSDGPFAALLAEKFTFTKPRANSMEMDSRWALSS